MRKIGFIRKVFAGWGVAGKRKAGAADIILATDLRYMPAPVAAIELFSYCMERVCPFIMDGVRFSITI